MSTPKRARRREADPTPRSPYEGYGEYAEHLTDRIIAAWERSKAADFPTWDKGGKGRKPQRLSWDDLGVGLWAVECVGSNGIHYGQLDRCFRDCLGVGCHNNKAAAIFKTLQEWGLIVKVGNYSVGRRGNVYAVAPEAVEFLGIRHEPPTPRAVVKSPRAPADAPATEPPPPPDDSDPW